MREEAFSRYSAKRRAPTMVKELSVDWPCGISSRQAARCGFAACATKRRPRGAPSVVRMNISPVRAT
jgi:hypothetical protein